MSSNNNLIINGEVKSVENAPDARDIKMAKLRNAMAEQMRGKGVMRRKKHVNKHGLAEKDNSEEVQLRAQLNKLSTHVIPDIKTIILLHKDGTSLEIINPKVEAVNKANTTIVSLIDSEETKFKHTRAPDDYKPEIISPEERKSNRNERKVVDALRKIPMNIMVDVVKVRILAKGVNFYIEKPDVLKLPNSQVYIIYGQCVVDNLMDLLKQTQNGAKNTNTGVTNEYVPSGGPNSTTQSFAAQSETSSPTMSRSQNGNSKNANDFTNLLALQQKLEQLMATLQQSVSNIPGNSPLNLTNKNVVSLPPDDKLDEDSIFKDAIKEANVASDKNESSNKQTTFSYTDNLMIA